MADLINKNINETYQGLLKTSSNSELAGSDLITDGNGVESALTLGIAGTGSIFSGGLTTTSNLIASCDITANQNLCVKGSSQIVNDISVCGDTNIKGITATNFQFGGGGTFTSAISFNNAISVIGISTLANTNVNGNITTTGNLTVGGTINASGDVIAFSSSDSRLKDNLIPIDSQNYVNNLTGFEFDWNERSKRSGKGKGIIAQDLYKIDKTLVHETNEGYLAVDYIGLIPVLIEEIKRLGNEIEKLKNN
jgi:hypothetical protein|tara:strand:+ start:7 stop:759 length:753 start_codon:yes stop_codon:yes gene_type:complete